MITRKKFILLGSLSFVSALIPNFIFSNILSTENSEDITSLLKKAKKFRKQNKLTLAKNVYEDVLVIDPTEIRAYNGIRKILLSKKNKEYQVIQLYEQALANIPTNVRIKQRLYNEYFKAALGNKKVFQKLNISGRPLVYIKEKYESLLTENPGQKNLEKQLAKVQKYINLEVDTKKPHQNHALKNYRKDQRNLHKHRFGKPTSQETNLRLSALAAETFSEDRLSQEREMSKINILALRSEKKYSEALAATFKYLNTKSASDAYFMNQFRNLSKQLNEYDKLIIFEQQNHNAKKSFWSGIALFDAYMRKAEKNNQTFSQMETLLQFLTENTNNPGYQFEVVTRKIKSNLLNNNITDARNLIIEQCKEKMGSIDAHSIDRINLLAARYYVKVGQSDKKYKILNIISDPSLYFQNQDELISCLALMNSKRSNKNLVHLDNLRKNINKL